MHATLRYLKPMAEKPFYYCYRMPHGFRVTNYEHDERELPIHDARPIASSFSLDRNGVAFMRHETAVKQLTDRVVVQRDYYPEISDLLIRLTGAQRVVIFDHTNRRNIPASESTVLCNPPIRQVHVDGVEYIAADQIRQRYPDQSDTWLRGRWQILNVWRPIIGPVLDVPLAFCVGDRIDASDLVATDLYFPDNRIALTYQLNYSKGHVWHFMADMMPSEVLIFKCFDSSRGADVRFVPHSAFSHPQVPAGAPLRESIEARAFVYLGE